MAIWLPLPRYTKFGVIGNLSQPHIPLTTRLFQEWTRIQATVNLNAEYWSVIGDAGRPHGFLLKIEW